MLRSHPVHRGQDGHRLDEAAASHDEIRREVDYSIETLGRGGGYVFCAAHNLQPDITPHRIEVMYQAALAHGAVTA